MTSIPKTRIVNVSYLNSTPYRAAEDLPFVEYHEATPAECSRMLSESEADMAVVPIADVFSHGGYHLLPLGIAARGPVESVTLFSHRPVEELQAILVDSNSHTSVMLLRELLAEINPQASRKLRFHRVNVATVENSLAEKHGLLVIGDRALQLADRFPFKLDLAQRWHEQTALPFVFAVWAYDPSRVDAATADRIAAQFELGIKQKLAYAREWAEKRGLDRAPAEHYVEHRIVYHLDRTIFSGAEEFFRRGAGLNLFPDAYSAPETFSSVAVLNGGKLQTVRQPKLNGTNGAAEFSRTRFFGARSIDDILSDASAGRRISLREGMALAGSASLADLALASDERRREIHRSPGVSYIIDRNINYTNVCNVYCRFCAFYRAPEIGGKPSKRSQGGYILTKEEIGKKIDETVRAGGIQILLQGGLNPDLGIEYYEDLFCWIKTNYPVNLHALSADEILHIARVSQLSLDEVFDRLIAVGLGSLPGGGAELLVDRVRRRIARLKSPAEEWLEVHRVAHRKGLTSTCTMLFGVQESWEDRFLHMSKLRRLQDESGGFTAFITWPFQDENTKLKRGDTSASEYLRVQAISRLFLDNIPNVQSSWVTMGPAVGQTALYFGANDYGSVMFEENVVSAAGTTYCMDTATIERSIIDAGFYPWRRNVHYQSV